MNEHIRAFGWLLFGIGSILTLMGLVALIAAMNIQIDAIGVDLDTTIERIAWIVCWLVAVVSGGILLALTQPDNGNRRESA